MTEEQGNAPLNVNPSVESLLRVIDCDACGEKWTLKEAKRCAQCKCAYYCNATCQKKHWKAEHKQFCLAMKQQSMDIARIAEPARGNEAAGGIGNGGDEEQECAICLQSPMVCPTRLDPCSHSFCSGCLSALRRSCPNAPCPLCRGAMPEDHTLPIQMEVSLLMRRADLARESSTEVSAALYDQAYEKIHLLSLASEGHIVIHFTLAEVQMCRSKFDEAKQILQQLIESTKPGAMMLGKRVANITEWRIREYVLLAQCEMELGQFKDAKNSFTEAFMLIDDDVGSLDNLRHETRKILHGLSKCAYELGRFDKSIALGMAAIEQNRHYDDHYTYVVLSHRKLGQLREAIGLLAQAVAYETPWFPDITKQRQASLEELLEELKTLD